MNARLLALAVASLLGGANSFLLPSSPSNVVISSRIGKTRFYSGTTGWDSFKNAREMTDVPGGEAQRKFRRTVYTH
eukprot:CAMPEP_0183294974 /NCGR_PEP_ID=MMETSP0160_2-20130417/3097_1 /TAXON_ID=2839 ORGANISM="Odontella Sinensis, Strain Grunow 1884" /NCGR_SAMPLE_ID=MMETSP0160_2 /ASSEMBLY_ACC=CAM_ASM_000250 /LENGTH=75 /DNA_ID=CAMNT_0025456369 /DNA_START=48 /DNA_END=272 /DNA_ORIENTATION=+